MPNLSRLSAATEMRYGFVRSLRVGIKAWMNPNEPPMRRLMDPQEAAIDGALAAIDLLPAHAAMYASVKDDGTHQYISPACVHGACDECDPDCPRCSGNCVCICHRDAPAPGGRR